MHRVPLLLYLSYWRGGGSQQTLAIRLYEVTAELVGWVLVDASAVVLQCLFWSSACLQEIPVQ